MKKSLKQIKFVEELAKKETRKDFIFAVFICCLVLLVLFISL